MNDRRLKSGYSDLGPIQIPPRPSAIVLTDRTTGLQWMLSFETSPVERISITQDLTALQKRDGAKVYSKDDGPVLIQDGRYTLFLDNGRLGIKFTSFSGDEIAFDAPPLYARQSSDQRLVNTDSSNMAVLHLGYIA